MRSLKVINTIWDSLRITKHKLVLWAERSPYTDLCFVISRFSQECLSTRTTTHRKKNWRKKKEIVAQSLFLSPILFGICGIMYTIPGLTHKISPQRHSPKWRRRTSAAPKYCRRVRRRSYRRALVACSGRSWHHQRNILWATNCQLVEACVHFSFSMNAAPPPGDDSRR